MRRGQTPSQTVGPFFAYAMTPEQYGYAYPGIAGCLPTRVPRANAFH
jgi:hypothetical protein